MMASSALGSMKPIDITPRLSSTYTGDQPDALCHRDPPQVK
jgi:hypothetical protein